MFARDITPFIPKNHLIEWTCEQVRIRITEHYSQLFDF